MNDSLRTTCCLRFKPKMIAIAAIYLASKMINQAVQLETLPNLKVVLEAATTAVCSPARSPGAVVDFLPRLPPYLHRRFRSWRR